MDKNLKSIARRYKKDYTGLFYFRSNNKYLEKYKKKKLYAFIRWKEKQLQLRYGFLYSLSRLPRHLKRTKNTTYKEQLGLKKSILAFYRFNDLGFRHLFERYRSMHKGKFSIHGSLNYIIFKLEMSLKMVVLRMGFVVTTEEAIYKIKAGFFFVNGICVREIYNQIRVGDFIMYNPEVYVKTLFRVTEGIMIRRIFSLNNNYIYLLDSNLLGLVMKQPKMYDIPFPKRLRLLKLFSLLRTKIF